MLPRLQSGPLFTVLAGAVCGAGTVMICVCGVGVEVCCCGAPVVGSNCAFAASGAAATTSRQAAATTLRRTGNNTRRATERRHGTTSITKFPQQGAISPLSQFSVIDGQSAGRAGRVHPPVPSNNPKWQGRQGLRLDVSTQENPNGTASHQALARLENRTGTCGKGRTVRLHRREPVNRRPRTNGHSIGDA